mgnify:CR=1 FL=1
MNELKNHTYSNYKCESKEDNPKPQLQLRERCSVCFKLKKEMEVRHKYHGDFMSLSDQTTVSTYLSHAVMVPVVMDFFMNNNTKLKSTWLQAYVEEFHKQNKIFYQGS